MATVDQAEQGSMATIIAGPPAPPQPDLGGSVSSGRPAANDSALGPAGLPQGANAIGRAPHTVDPSGDGDGDGLENLPHRPALAAVYRHWLVQHRDERPPTRRELEPAGMAEVLPNVLLADRIEDAAGAMLRFRLVGTGINGAYGMGELTHRTSRQTVTPRDHDRIMADVERALATGRPNLRHRQVERPTDAVPVVYWRLMLPLARIAGEPPCLLIAVDTMAARPPAVG